MAWTHDADCLALESELRQRYGDSAFVVAISRIVFSEDEIKRLKAQLVVANNKVLHRCGHGHCADCGG